MRMLSIGFGINNFKSGTIIQKKIVKTIFGYKKKKKFLI